MKRKRERGSPYRMHMKGGKVAEGSLLIRMEKKEVKVKDIIYLTH